MIQHCSWCGSPVNLSSVDTTAFSLDFSSVTHSDIFGPSGWSFRVDNLCLDCGSKLFHELKRLGIEVIEGEF